MHPSFFAKLFFNFSQKLYKYTNCALIIINSIKRYSLCGYWDFSLRRSAKKSLWPFPAFYWSFFLLYMRLVMQPSFSAVTLFKHMQTHCTAFLSSFLSLDSAFSSFCWPTLSLEFSCFCKIAKNLHLVTQFLHEFVKIHSPLRQCHIQDFYCCFS